MSQMATSRPASRRNGTTTTRTTAVKRPPRALLEEPAAGIQPVDFDALAEQEGEQERVHLFTLKGKQYFIPATPPAAFVLTYLRTMRTGGQEAAAGMLLEIMLGEEGYTALMNDPSVTLEHLGQLLKAVEQHTLGAAEKAGIQAPLGG